MVVGSVKSVIEDFIIFDRTLKDKYGFGSGLIDESIVLEDHEIRGLEAVHAQCLVEYGRLKAEMEEKFHAFRLQ